MKSKIIKIFIFFISVVLVFPVIFTAQGCKDGDAETSETGSIEETAEQEIDDINGTGNEDRETGVSPQKGSDSDRQKTGTNDTETETMDISELRLFFTQAIEYLDKDSYLIAEFYLNKIKDSYMILQDHIYYYMAKTLLSQGKYYQAEEYYLKLIKKYPDSIWAEIANLEYAGIFYAREDYITAESEYTNFLTDFPESSNVPYCLFLLAVSQEMNGKKDLSAENYKEIWLNYPLSEYSEIAWESLDRLAEEGSIEPFIPTANQIYTRGDIFFSIGHYNSALDEFNWILQEDYVNSLSQDLYAKTLFKIGRCYHKLSDSNQAKNYLLQSYQKYPTGLFADDSLYYLGVLNQNEEAISYYQKLVELFPSSNFSDDALYNIGKIFSSREDFTNAAAYFKRVSAEYPQRDMTPYALWELGLIQYRAGDYGSAKITFSSYASSYKGTSLEEQGLFWQAKCSQKLGENNTALDLYKRIVNLNSYSYYTFASAEMLEKMNIPVTIRKINNDLNPENPEISDILPDVYSILEEESYNNIDETGVIGHINKVIEFLKLGFLNSASLEIEAATSEIEENPVKNLVIATLYLKSNNYHNSIGMINLKKLKAELGEPYTDYLYYLYHPYGYKEIVQKYSTQYKIDPLLILAVIRQESVFDSNAISGSNAQGLMQILPSTGKGIASDIGISGFNVGMLTDPDTNIKMGTYYLRQQLNYFGEDNLVYCLGAYNGGPNYMKGLVSRRGNMDIDEFIESISKVETRDYVKIVMRNYYFYQMLYNE